MKFRNTAFVLGVGAATAPVLSMMKVDKPIVFGSTVVVTSTGLILSRSEKRKARHSIF